MSKKQIDNLFSLLRLTIVAAFLSIPTLVRAQSDTSEIIIQIDEGYNLKDVLDLSGSARNQSWSIEKIEHISSIINAYLLTLESGSDCHTAIVDLLTNHSILYAHPNYRLQTRSKTPNDPLYQQQWNMSKIGMEDVWQEMTGGLTYNGDTIVIGVMEAGLDTDHEDLASILWVNHREIPDNNFDDDHNGYIDDYKGVSLDNGKDRHTEDPDGHGTSVLGVLGASGDNAIGVSGVNWNIKIALFSTLDLSLSNAIKAYSYFTEMRKKYNESSGTDGAFIVATNSSYGREGLFEDDAPIFCELFDAMGEQGILSVGAAENDQGNADVFGDLPANCSSENLIIATSTDVNDELAVAGFGKTTVDLGAPGEAILTTTNDSNYKSISGTSFSTPLVCGAIALLYSHPSKQFSDLTKSSPKETSQLIKELLLNNVTKINSLSNRTVTEGRLNLRNTYGELLSTYPIDPTATRVVTFPNPVIQNTTISFNEAISNFRIEVFDISGKKVLEEKINDQLMSEYNLNMAPLTSGIYFIAIHTQTNGIQTRVVKF